MEYAVKLKAPYDMTEFDFAKGNILCEEKNGIRYGVWFEYLTDAHNACIEHNGYGIIEGENLDIIWINPDYKSEGIKNLAKELGRKLLPKRA